MDTTISQLQNNAQKHARRAHLLWAECCAILTASDFTSLYCAIELNGRAIDQWRAAINTMDFIQRYSSQIETQK